jgi:hypothetical protein
MKWVYGEEGPSETPPPWGFGESDEHPAETERSEPAGEGVN